MIEAGDGFDHFAVIRNAFIDFEARSARDQRLTHMLIERIEFSARLPTQGENVSEAACRDQRRWTALAFDQRIGANRRAMAGGRIGERPPFTDAVKGLQHGAARIVGRRRNLERIKAGAG